MARLTVDLELEQVRAIVRDLDSTLDPVGFARLHGGVSDVYRIDLAGAENPLILKIYGDEPAWIVAKEALVAGWIGERAGIPIPRWLRVDERRTCIPSRFALTTWLPGVTVRSLIGALGIDAAYRQMGALLRRLHAIPMTAYGYIVADGIWRPQPTNDEYMHSAFNQAFRRFRELGGEETLTRRLEENVQSRFNLLQYSARPVFCHDDLQQGNVLAEYGRNGTFSSPSILAMLGLETHCLTSRRHCSVAAMRIPAAGNLFLPDMDRSTIRTRRRRSGSIPYFIGSSCGVT